MPDAATDVQPTQPVDATNPAGINVPAAPAPNFPTNDPNNPKVGVDTPAPPQGNAPGAQIPKQSFREGMQRMIPNYRLDENGNVVSAQPVRAPSVRGVLGSVLMGALQGAAAGASAQAPEGSRGKGAAFSAGAAAAEKARIAADDRARAIAQRNFENQQAATAAKLRGNLIVAQTHDLVQKSQFDAENHAADLKSRGIEDEEHQISVQNGLDQRRQVHADLIHELTSHGVQPYATLSQTPNADGKTMAAQANAHIGALVGNKALPVQNGQIGEQNGAVLFSDKDLDAPITGTPIAVPSYDGTKDNKGNFVSHDVLWKPDGKTTYRDVALQFMAADAQLDKFMKRDAAQMSKKYQQAEIGEKEAQAGLQEAQAEQIRKQTELLGAYAPPVGFQPNPQAFNMSRQDLLNDLQQKGVKIPPDFADLYAAGHYDIDANKTFPIRTTKGTNQTDIRNAKNFILTYINPTFKDSVFPTIQKVKTDFITGKEGQAVRSFNQFLVHSADLEDVSNQMQRSGSPWVNKPLNSIRSGGLGDPSVPRLMTAIEAARQEWQTFIDSGYKPDAEQSARAEILMSDKSTPSMIMGVLGIMGDQAIGRLDQLNETYKTATGKNYPNLVTPSGLAAAQRLGLGQKLTQYQSGGNFIQNENPQQSAPPKPFTNRAGQSFNVDANGQFTAGGWIYKVQTDENGNYTGAKAVKPAAAQ